MKEDKTIFLFIEFDSAFFEHVSKWQSKIKAEMKNENLIFLYNICVFYFSPAYFFISKQKIMAHNFIHAHVCVHKKHIIFIHAHLCIILPFCWWMPKKAASHHHQPAMNEYTHTNVHAEKWDDFYIQRQYNGSSSFE
jgi:hypothetical protein